MAGGAVAVVGLAVLAVVLLRGGKKERGEPPPAGPATPTGAPADTLAEALAEADRLDPGWRFEQLDARRAAVPDDRNGALQLLAIRRQLPPGWPAAELQQTLDALPPPLERPPADQVAALRQALQPTAAALAPARRLVDFPSGRAPLKWEGLATLLPHAEAARDAGALLAADAIVRAADGDGDVACQSVRAVIHAGRALGDEPGPVSQLLRMALARRASFALQWVLAQAEPPEAALRLIQQELQEEADHPGLLLALRGERALRCDCFERLARGDRDWMAQYQIPPLDGRLDEVRAVHARALHNITEGIEIAKRPQREQPTACADWSARSQAAVPAAQGPVEKGLADVFTLNGPPEGPLKMFQAGWRIQSTLRTAVVGVAAQRYRLTHPGWPERLEDLVATGLLREVPADPDTDGPLRLRSIGLGLVVYSARAQKGPADDPQQLDGNLCFRLAGATRGGSGR